MRGTGVAVYDFARYSETLLGHESIVVCPSAETQPAFQSAIAASHFEQRFPVYRYKDFSEVDDLLKDLGSDVFYAIKAGHKDPIVSQVSKTVVHAVFQHREAHGDVYAYFSEWLAEEMSGGDLPWVAPMVDLPQVDGNLREELAIPSDAIVYGRHGGYPSFDIPFVHSVVHEVAAQSPELFFLFLNTRPFCDPLPNIIHLPETSDVRRKVRFINSCDAMLHARRLGESFGLAIGEFSARNRPIITYLGGSDRAHLKQLGDSGRYYRDENELRQLLLSFKPEPSTKWDVYSEPYSPVAVMDRFRQVFLEDSPFGERLWVEETASANDENWIDPIFLNLPAPNGASPKQSSPAVLSNQRPHRSGVTHPIGFAIPEELFVRDLSVLKKNRYAAAVTPLDRDTYIYPPTPEGEQAYLKQYRDSFFGVTCKKGGWDCFRHYEIMSQGCMPWFFDIKECPSENLIHLPKGLLAEALLLPGCALNRATGQVHVADDRFDETAYWQLLEELCSFARQHLTTAHLANRVLDRAGAASCERILVLSVQPNYIDYLAGMLLHGLRSLPSIHVTDYPKMEYMYVRPDRPHDRCEPNMWGMGFSLAHRLAESPDVNRSSLHARIGAGEFDLIIYPDAGSSRPDRPLPFWDLVSSRVAPNRVLLVDGQDDPSRKLAHFANSAQLFQRERA